ncbi:MAG: uncharacterized protein A8A55_0745 [Amphiamblys sp. WSBS2006]|nr:MAG: uncharacterized protein A8A55_0745 [Amphiamblys sp. WSBS2006]
MFFKPKKIQTLDDNIRRAINHKDGSLEHNLRVVDSIKDRQCEDRVIEKLCMYLAGPEAAGSIESILGLADMCLKNCNVSFAQSFFKSTFSKRMVFLLEERATKPQERAKLSECAHEWKENFSRMAEGTRFVFDYKNMLTKKLIKAPEKAVAPETPKPVPAPESQPAPKCFVCNRATDDTIPVVGATGKLFTMCRECLQKPRVEIPEKEEAKEGEIKHTPPSREPTPRKKSQASEKASKVFFKQEGSDEPEQPAEIEPAAPPRETWLDEATEGRVFKFSRFCWRLWSGEIEFTDYDNEHICELFQEMVSIKQALSKRLEAIGEETKAVLRAACDSVLIFEKKKKENALK